MKRALGDTGVTIEAVVSDQITYQLDGVPARSDLNRRTYQPSTATIVIRDGAPETITIAGYITRGLFAGRRTSVDYRIIDDYVTVDGRIEHQPPYWLQMIVDMHRPTRRRSVRIHQPNEGSVVVYFGDDRIAGATVEEHGPAGLRLVVETARSFAAAIDTQVIFTSPKASV